MATIKEQHEEEIQKMLEETKLKIESYKDIMKEDSNQRKLIESLEKKISIHEKEKLDAQETFKKYQEIMEEKASEMKTSHSEKMISLSNEVLNMKKNFESQLEKLIYAKKQIQEEKDKVIGDLKKSYEFKTEELKSGLSSTERHNEAYQSQIKMLEDERNRFKLENKELKEDFEIKFKEQKSMFEKELESLSSSQTNSHEERMKNLQEDYDKLLKVHEDMNLENLQKIKDLISKLEAVETEAENYKNTIETLKSSMNDMNSKSTSLSEQLSIAQEELSKTISTNKQLEADIKAINDRCEKQSTELVDKSCMIFF